MDNHIRPAGYRQAQAPAFHGHIGVGGIQMAVTAGESNVPRIERLVAYTKWKYPWVEMMLFPELCVFGPDPRFAEPFPGDTLSRLCAIAAASNVWLIPGSMLEAAEGAVFNSAPVVNPQGQPVARHRKLFAKTPAEMLRAFLRLPAYQTAYGQGYGTLYTSLYRPDIASAELIWPSGRWSQSCTTFRDGARAITYGKPDI